MIIDFEKTEQKIFPNFNGGEKEFKSLMYNDSGIKIMKGTLVKGASIGMHTHKTNSEIIYVLSGKGKMHYDDTVEILSAGMSHYCPKGHSHSFLNENDEDLVFFALVPELNGDK